MLLFKFGYRVYSRECENGYIHSARNIRMQLSISADYFRSLRDAARTECNIFFFLFPPISLGRSACGCVCVCVYRSLRYGSNFVIFSDFSPRMFVNVLLFRKLLAREMSFILGTAKDTFFYSLFRSDRKRTLLGHC